MRRRWIGKRKGAASSLVANYKFNETSGTTVIDSFGANNGTSANCTINQTGKLGSAYLFNLNTSSVQIPYSTELDFTDATSDLAFSVSMWVKMDVDKSTFLIGKTDGTSRNWELIHENSKLYFRLCSGGNLNNRLQKIAVPQIGVWQNIIATYNGAQGTNLEVLAGMNLYINNSAATNQQSELGTYVKMAQNTNPLWIGKFPTLTTYTLNGLQDEIEIYKNHVLTGAERNAIWNNGNGRTL